ncbi:hypothetical protein M8C21_022435 [Ambrosia artemisiifolia]|uniref:Uncharacterized protein n=1 Tax=Ambrosia artemisiifolia TaxID=4212 RepID=A0AAD5D029_AMBAR|nr:hypothetical protein M8C21_022435 [Ambrosia artemisiifolia]
MIDMAKLLAKQPNVTVTIVTTPLNAIRYGATLTGLIETGLPVRFLELPFPAAEAGLPEGCESTDKIPSMDLVPNFLAAIGMLQHKLEERYDMIKPVPSCVISDKYMSWTGDFADKYKLPRIMFDGMSCFTQLCYNNLYEHKVFQGLNDSDPFVVPGLPDRIELTRKQLPAEFNPSSVDTSEFRQRARDAEVRAYGVVINSFEELEYEYVKEYKKLRGGKVWCIGPLSLCDSDNLAQSQRGNKAAIDEEQCIKWLDSHKPDSVVYACFGSLVRVNTPQLIELGLGLEASNSPFIWVIKSVHREKEVEDWLAESGFEERVKDRGLIIRGWAPQVLILSHPSVGGFLTHCVVAGTRLWNPCAQFAEQFINEKLVVQVLGIGVGVGADSVVHVGEEDLSGVKVKSESVKNAIEKLHFLVVPLGSPGHYIPTIDLAKLLAQHGVKVTIVTTPVNTIRFGSILDQAIQSGLPISFLELQLPYMKFGLPEGCESLDDLPDLSLGHDLFLAQSSLQQEVEQYIERLNPRPSCILSGTFLLWTCETAKKFQIPRIVFDGMNCFTQMCNHVLYLSKLSFLFNSGSKDVKDFSEKLRKSESEAFGVVINSFYELEPKYADAYQKIKKDKAWCVGPLSLCHKYAAEKVQRGNRSSISENECIKWLDSQENESVIYACLGSISRIEPVQLIELALALESSKKPFIWVVRAGHKTEKIEKWIDEEGFAERTKDRALLIRGWAPQLLVLSHPAVGAFLTHCGWNSALEGISAGVPMVTWPQFQEQFYNEKLLVQVLRIGVSVGVQKVVHLGEEEKSGVVVKSEDLRKAIEMVMVDGKESEDRRKRARDLGKMANEAIEEGGSSYRNMTRLIQDIRNQYNTN